MLRPIVTIPFSQMRLTEVDWWIDWRGQAGSERVGGGTQIVFNQFPRFVANPAFAFNRQEIGDWRAAMWQAQGRIGMFRLFMIDSAIFDRSSVLPALWQSLGKPFSNEQRFSSGMGFEAGPYVPATEAAAPGDTSIRLTITDPALVPVAGQIISAGDWPMGVTSVAREGATDVYELSVVLQRATIAQGDPINLVARGLFEMVDDMGGQAVYGGAWHATPRIALREVLNR